MLGKNTGQLDLFTQMMYEKLILENHLLLDIDKYIDFSFVYDIVKDFYSKIGRKSCDPLVIFKMLLASESSKACPHKEPRVEVFSTLGSLAKVISVEPYPNFVDI